MSETFFSVKRREIFTLRSANCFTFCILHTAAKYTALFEKPCFTDVVCVPGSSVGIATDYGLDGPGSNPGREEIFRPSKPALGPTQPPVQWVRGLSRG